MIAINYKIKMCSQFKIAPYIGATHYQTKMCSLLKGKNLPSKNMLSYLLKIATYGQLPKIATYGQLPKIATYGQLPKIATYGQLPKIATYGPNIM